MPNIAQKVMPNNSQSDIQITVETVERLPVITQSIFRPAARREKLGEHTKVIAATVV